MLGSEQILNGTYRIIGQIGCGDGGTVYKAYHLRIRKYVAVKLINDNIKSDFYNRAEVDVLKNLKNNYLPQVLDFVEDGDDIYTVMEFIEGQNFMQLISGESHFSEKQVRKYALQLCEAVDYLHNQDTPIIHSDIKPANIMLTPQDNICLIDFNISMISDDGIAVSKGGSEFFGAPEQFRRLICTPDPIDGFHEETRFLSSNEETEIIMDASDLNSTAAKNQISGSQRAYIDVLTDIYGMGASLYYILTERIPYNSRPDFRGINVSAGMRNVIAKAMDRDPKARFRSAADMRAALEKTSDRPLNRAAVVSVGAVCVIAAAMVIGKLMGAFGQNDMTAAVTSSDTTQPSVSEQVSADEAETEGITEYYPDGSVKCERINADKDGSYQLMWYDMTGAKDLCEHYDKYDQMKLVDVYFADGKIKSAVPELSENGYSFIIKSDDDKEYPYQKYVKNESRETEKIIYCDENKNEIFWLRYTQKLFDDGTKEFTWFEQNGDIFQRHIYDPDGSKTVEFYENGRKYLVQSVDSSGNVQQHYEDDNDG